MNAISALLKIILSQYFLSTRCIFLFTSDARDPVLIPFGYAVVTVNIDSVSYKLNEVIFRNHGCQVFLFNLDDPTEVFQGVEKELKIQNETFWSRSYIFLNSKREAIGKLLSTKEIGFIFNFLLVTESGPEGNEPSSLLPTWHKTYVLWTQIYTGNCTLEFLDKWFSGNKSFLFQNNLFPEKVNYKFGRIYRLGFFPYLPYVFMPKKKHFQTMVLDGVEGTIINHFFGKFNLTWNPIWVKKEYWGDVFDNGSSYGLRGELFKDKIDLAIAANFMTDRMYRFYGMTVPILRVGITCLVPAPKPIPSWLTPWHVYSKLLWLVIILAYLLIVCAILCVYWTTESCTREDFRENGFYKRLSNIGETVFIVFTHHFTKNGILRGHTRNIFVTLTLFVTFFLSRCYESGLSSIMTIPSYGSSIETNHDFLESNISWGGIQVADWIMHWQTDKEERYRRAHRRYVAVSSQNVLKKLMAAGNFGLLIERISPDIFHFPFSNLENAKTLRLMKEDIQWEYTVIFLRKSAPLIPYLDKFLLELKEGGIIKYWLDEAAAKVLPRTAQKEVRRLSLHYEPVVEKLVQLKLVHVAGIFGIMAVGNLFAIVAFLLELIYYKRFS